MLLDADGGGVARGVRVHRADHGRDRRLLVVAGRRVRHVGTQEYHRLVEYLCARHTHIHCRPPTRNPARTDFRDTITEDSEVLIIDPRFDIKLPPSDEDRRSSDFKK